MRSKNKLHPNEGLCPTCVRPAGCASCTGCRVSGYCENLAPCSDARQMSVWSLQPYGSQVPMVVCKEPWLMVKPTFLLESRSLPLASRRADSQLAHRWSTRRPAHMHHILVGLNILLIRPLAEKTSHWFCATGVPTARWAESCWARMNKRLWNQPLQLCTGGVVLTNPPGQISN